MQIVTKYLRPKVSRYCIIERFRYFFYEKHTSPCGFANRDPRGIAHYASILTQNASRWRTGPKPVFRILIPFLIEQIEWNLPDRQVGPPKIVAVRHLSTFVVLMPDSWIQNTVIMKAFLYNTQKS